MVRLSERLIHPLQLAWGTVWWLELLQAMGKVNLRAPKDPHPPPRGENIPHPGLCHATKRPQHHHTHLETTRHQLSIQPSDKITQALPLLTRHLQRLDTNAWCPIYMDFSKWCIRGGNIKKVGMFGGASLFGFYKVFPNCIWFYMVLCGFINCYMVFNGL